MSHRAYAIYSLPLLAAVLLAGCSSSSSPTSNPDSGGSVADSGGSNTDSGGTTSNPDSGCSGSTPVSLTVLNYDSWCSVTVGTNAAFTGPSESYCVAAGSVSLAATPLSGFELGPDPWHDAADAGSSGDTTVTVSSGSKCVWVCCPFTDGTGCPTTDQCPQ